MFSTWFPRLGASTAFRRPSYIRAAHYFSDGWPLDSLLVMRRRTVRRDLRRIRQDGFNTIILVVPWRGLQSSQTPVEYDDFYRSQLCLVLSEAQRAGIAVILRVGYAHQVMLGPSMGGIHQAQCLLTDPVIEAAWLDYHREIARIAADYSCCIGGFASWEELWHAFGHWQALEAKPRQQAAKASGYVDFLEEQSIAHNGEIPPPDTTEQEHYLAFVNRRIRQLFERARECWPLLGVEYRVDKNPVHTPEGLQWFENDKFLDWEPNRYSYWAPFMGARNEGEQLTAQEAETLLRYMLESTTPEGGDSGQILEQFNFVDNTQRYVGTHAQIAEDQIDAFLSCAAPLLKASTGGYGLWAPRDYRLNILYNTAFLDAGRGWSLLGGEWLPGGGASLARSSRLSQRIERKISWLPRIHPFTEIRLELDVKPHISWRREAVTIRARLNGGEWRTLAPTSVRHRFAAMLPADFEGIFKQGIDFELENEARPVSVLRLQLYDQTYAAGVRNVDGNPGAYLDGVRRFNRQLS